jgi:hypothetical protein
MIILFIIVTLYLAAVASVTSQLVLTPFSVITTRLHINRGPSIPSWQVLSSIVSKHGGSWSILWTGYFSALLQSIPHNMVMFTVYNYSKSYVASLGIFQTPTQDLVSRFVCSILGSYAAVLVTSPIDITRTHRQALISASGGGADKSLHLPSSWSVMKDIYKKFGIRYMYRGATARLLSSTPYTVAMLIGYDYVKLFSIKCHDNS